MRPAVLGAGLFWGRLALLFQLLHSHRGIESVQRAGAGSRQAERGVFSLLAKPSPRRLSTASRESPASRAGSSRQRLAALGQRASEGASSGIGDRIAGASPPPAVEHRPRPLVSSGSISGRERRTRRTTDQERSPPPHRDPPRSTLRRHRPPTSRPSTQGNILKATT